MARLSDLLSRPAIAQVSRRLCDAGYGREVRGVALVEDMRAIDDRMTDQVLVLTGHSSARIDRYLWDVLLNRAVAANAAGVGLAKSAAGREQLPATTRALAERGQISVFLIDPAADLGRLLITMHQEIAGDLPAVVDRAARALAALASAQTGGDPADDVAKIAGSGLGLPVTAGTPASASGVPVVVDEQVEAVLLSPWTGTAADTIVELVLHRAAQLAAQRIAAARRAVDVPVATRAALLAELVYGPAEAAGPLLTRARRAGLAVDGWHTVVHVDLDNVEELSDGDEVTRYELVAEAGRLGLQTTLADSGQWYRAEAGSSLVFVRIDRAEPAASIARTVHATAVELLARLCEQFSRLRMYCGIGGSYRGLEGLQTSATEARAGAAAARSSHRPGQPVVFRNLGLRRTLLQWYSMASSRALVDRLLAPLDDLEPKRRTEALQTLHAYLESPGATGAAAEAIGVHRNTMNNRIKRLFDLLDLDENNADHRLMLQLACRLHLSQ